jgi:RNA polymerase sigma factor (sigma-70 family)
MDGTKGVAGTGAGSTAGDTRSDGELLLASGDDPEAFGVFFDRHARPLLGFFYRRTADAETAAELCAETFAAAFAKRRRYRDTGAPARAWLYTIARRQLARLARRRAVSDRYRARLGMDRRVDVDEQSRERIEALVDFEPEQAALRTALRSLPRSQAAALLLRIGHELPYHEVARQLGCSEGAARVRVARGLSKLATTMEAS